MNVKIIVTKDLRRGISKIFKKESRKIFDLFDTLKENLEKGKFITVVGSIVLKELKYKTHRFYFLIKKDQIILLKKEELEELLIIFLALSKKNNQQETIKKLKALLKQLEG